MMTWETACSGGGWRAADSTNCTPIRPDRIGRWPLALAGDAGSDLTFKKIKIHDRERTENGEAELGAEGERPFETDLQAVQL